MYTREIVVMPSDVSCNGRIKLRSLLNYFQDTAGLAVQDVEGTTTELIARGYAWVLMKYEIDFHGELPRLDEAFTISTYHDPNHGYNTLRMFHAPFVSAKTSWLLLDVNSGRPVKPLAHIPGIDSRDTQDIPPDFREIPDIETATHSTNIPVMYHDLDYNGHVNNAAYFEWVHDNSPVDPSAHNLVKVCASFRSGARLGETVTLNFGENSGCVLCRVSRPNMAKPSANFLCEWRSNDA